MVEDGDGDTINFSGFDENAGDCGCEVPGGVRIVAIKDRNIRRKAVFVGVFDFLLAGESEEE